MEGKQKNSYLWEDIEDRHMTRVFISSVQKEFAQERKALCKYIREDVLLCKFFQPFIFEELPAIDQTAQEAYLAEAAQSDIYLGIFGKDYGFEDAEGVSPTEREFDTATENNRYRLIFVKRCQERHPKEDAFVKKAEAQLVRKSFTSYDELRSHVYAALVRFLEEKEFLRLLPWDATFNQKATLDDIDLKKVETFVDIARQKRGSKLIFTGNNVLDILISQNLASVSGRLTNAAILLFGKNPQKFFLSSIVKCSVFPTEKMTKPILSYQVYGGTLFEMIDSAKSFVIQHIDARVSSRSTGTKADIEYEIPMEAIAEAIANACVHRALDRNSSVQVMLFPDRLEVWNPGGLPNSLTKEMLVKKHSSEPVNPLLAGPAFLNGYIEHLGTGTTDIISYCEAAGLPTPTFELDGDFRVIIWRKRQNGSGPQYDSAESGFRQNGPQSGPQNGPQNKLLSRYRKVLETMLSNPHVTKEDLANLLGVGRTTIRRDLQELRKTYRIEWVGSAKNGMWTVEKIK